MSMRNLSNWFAYGIVGFLSIGTVSAAEIPEKAAAKTDGLLREEVPFANAGKKAPPRVDDERFYRRRQLREASRGLLALDATGVVDEQLRRGLDHCGGTQSRDVDALWWSRPRSVRAAE